MTPQFKGFLIVLALAVGGFMLISSAADKEEDEETTQAGSAPRVKILNLAYQFSPGTIFNHDFYITNASGEDLSEVRIRFQFVGENASPSVDRYWATWRLGEKQQVQVPVESVLNVQNIRVTGQADQGIFDADLVQRP